MEVIEPPQAQTPTKQGRLKAVPFFNSTNAKAFSEKAHAAKKQAAIDRQAQIDKAKDIAALVPTESYRLTRLARVRAQLDAVDSEIEKAVKSPKPDQSRLKALIEAQSRLSEQERKLDNRPDPGSRRPGREKPDKRSGASGPLDAE